MPRSFASLRGEGHGTGRKPTPARLGPPGRPERRTRYLVRVAALPRSWTPRHSRPTTSRSPTSGPRRRRAAPPMLENGRWPRPKWPCSRVQRGIGDPHYKTQKQVEAGVANVGKGAAKGMLSITTGFENGRLIVSFQPRPGRHHRSRSPGRCICFGHQPRGSALSPAV